MISETDSEDNEEEIIFDDDLNRKSLPMTNGTVMNKRSNGFKQDARA